MNQGPSSLRRLCWKGSVIWRLYLDLDRPVIIPILQMRDLRLRAQATHKWQSSGPNQSFLILKPRLFPFICTFGAFIQFPDAVTSSPRQIHTNQDRTVCLKIFLVIKINRNGFNFISNYNDMNTWADELLNKCLQFSVENRVNLVAWPVSSRTAEAIFYLLCVPSN